MRIPDVTQLCRKVLACAAALLGLSILFACDYASMRNDAAINTYEITEPAMPNGTVPTVDGYMFIKEANPEDLVNPFPYSLKTAREGQVKYNWYCIQCHGPAGEGDGTVGQSFVPLPRNLKGSGVQSKTDGEIFKIIMLGMKKMPPLLSTVTREEGWSIINYIRWLGTQSGGRAFPEATAKKSATGPILPTFQ